MKYTTILKNGQRVTSTDKWEDIVYFAKTGLALSFEIRNRTYSPEQINALIGAN